MSPIGRPRSEDFTLKMSVSCGVKRLMHSLRSGAIT
jgi:hypothetical protein